MFKKTSFILCVGLLSFSFTQDDFKKTIVKFLSDSTSYIQVQATFNVIEKHEKTYPLVYGYIPTISPINPYKTKRVSSKFGKRFHPLDKTIKPHLGLDLAAPYGTPVHATASGIVIKEVISSEGYGNQLYILHGFGFKTRYAHMHHILFKKGDIISKGDVIGFVGSTGKSTGSHLHYEIIKNNTHLDPYPFCFINK